MSNENEFFITILAIFISLLVVLVCGYNGKIRGKIALYMTLYKLRNLDGDMILRHLSFDRSNFCEDRDNRAGLTLLSELMNRFDTEGD